MKSFHPMFEISSMLLRCSIVIFKIADGLVPKAYALFTISKEYLGKYVKYLKISKECLVSVKEYSAVIQKIDDQFSCDFIDGLLSFIKAVQFAFVGESIVKENQHRKSAGFLKTSVSLLQNSIKKLTNYKYSKFVHSKIEFVCNITDYCEV